MRSDAQRVGEVGNLLSETVAVGNGAFQAWIGKRIGQSAFLLAGILVDGLIRVAKPLSDDRVSPAHEQTEKESRLLLARVLHFVDKQKGEALTQPFAHLRYAVEQFRGPQEHLSIAE